MLLPRKGAGYLRMVLFSVSCLIIFPFFTVGQTHYARQFVMVAGKKMSYESFGLKTRRSGAPVLVFEGGFGVGGAKNFEGLFQELSKVSAGVAYDRNGEGESDEDSTLLTDSKLIHRLHDFLEASHIVPPYILVGHSMGGPYIRLFTALYPTEVVGLVFIDPADFMLTKEQDEQVKIMSHSEQGSGAWVVPAMKKIENDSSASIRVRHRAKRLAMLFDKGYFLEYTSLAPLPDIPVTVLLAYNKKLDTSAFSREELSRFKAQEQFEVENYTNLIANNHNCSVILLTGYGHFIHKEDPNYVVSVIERVYQKATSGVKYSKNN
jgi:pimeloyl-ACP methyl ester carboxylesterase